MLSLSLSGAWVLGVLVSQSEIIGYALGFTGLTRPTERVFCGVISQISNAVPSLLRYYWYSLSMTVDCRNPGESWTDVDGSRHSISWPAYRVDTQQYLAIGQTNFTHTIFHQLVVVFSCSHNWNKTEAKFCSISAHRQRFFFGPGTDLISRLILFLFCFLLGRTIQKNRKLRRFKSDRDEIWQNCWRLLSKCASIDGVGFLIWPHNFKMTPMTSFHTEKCCRLMSAYAASARRIFTSVRQFLIPSTFVLDISNII